MTQVPEDRLSRIASGFGRVIPDALSTSIALLLLVFGAALAMGNGVGPTMDAYYRGLWMLLPFTMQMTLILVLSSTLSTTAFFRRLVAGLSTLPRTRFQVFAGSMLLSAAMAYLYWGLGIALGPITAVYFAREAERRGIVVDFPFLLAATGAATSVWQFGLSASAPLLMNTPGHFLEKTTGLMPLRTTIFAPASIAFVVAFLLVSLLVARFLEPRNRQPISSFPESNRVGEDGPVGGAGADSSAGLSHRIEASLVPLFVLSIALAAWLFYHFAVKGSGLDLNSLNTFLLLGCILLHRNVRNFSRALQTAVVSAWPVVVLYHLYAGVAGLIQFTSVGENFAAAFAAISTHLTFPFLTALAAAVVSVFVPSSGGQWAIQGLITAKTAVAVGVTAQRGLLALSVGDHVGNLLSPFWVVIGAGVARIDFRRIIGHKLIFAAVWFVLGVLAFTFLPA
jgi:short-chain fatty acids transporter